MQNEEDILFAGFRPDAKVDSSLLSPGSVSSLNSLPTSPSSAVDERAVHLQNKSSPLLKEAAELCNEKEHSNTDHLPQLSSIAYFECNERPPTLQNQKLHVSNLPVGESVLQDCPTMRSSYEESLPSGGSFNDPETTETVQLDIGTRLSEEETRILKSELAFSQDQCHKLREQITELKGQLEQCEAEKEQLELELGMKSFLLDKQKRSEKVLQSFRAHAREQNRSSTACGASYAFTSVKGKLLGGASPLHEPGISLQGRLLEISNSLTEAEVRKIQFLARSKVNTLRLRKIREGYELFEELETKGELSCTFVRALLEGIQRLDLVEKLDLPLRDNAKSGMVNKVKDSISSLGLAIVPSGDKKLDVLLKRHDDAVEKTSVKIHQQSSEETNRESEVKEADSGCNMYSGNSESTRGEMAVLSMNANCYDSSMQSESSSEEHTHFPWPGVLSSKSFGTGVSSLEMSANSAMTTEPSTDDSSSSSCTSQDSMLGLPSAFMNCESSGDRSYNSKSSVDNILQSSSLPDDTESESGGTDTVEANTAQDKTIFELLESSGDVCGGPKEPAHLEMRCDAGAGTDVVDGGPLHDRGQSCSPSGLMACMMKDALPDGDISRQKNETGASSGVQKASTVDHSASDASMQSNEWERLGARPRDRLPVKMTTPAPSLVDLVPQEVAGPAVHGVANAFLARHSEDKGLHESLLHETVLTGDTSSQGNSYVDGMLNLGERNRAKPYFGNCQDEFAHSRPPFPIPEGGYDSRNGVGDYAYNGQFSSQTELAPGPSMYDPQRYRPFNENTSTVARGTNNSRVSQLVTAFSAREKCEPQDAGASLLSANTGGSMANRDFGTESVESTDNSLLALEQRVEACALVERVLREREEREQFGREKERKEQEIREQRARKRREREARELEEASRWPQQQEAVTGRSQWLCEHYQRHCRVRFPCCSHFFPCHRCHNNSKTCDNEEAKASHATHLKCSFCHHEQEIDEDSRKCRKCGAQMSAYLCSTCKHFARGDNNPYHCKKCGVCRASALVQVKERKETGTGSREEVLRWFCICTPPLETSSQQHSVCKWCFRHQYLGPSPSFSLDELYQEVRSQDCSAGIPETHMRPDSGHDLCCICLEDAFSGCQILPCSHKVHRDCAIAMIQNGVLSCPICRHPLFRLN